MATQWYHGKNIGGIITTCICHHRSIGLPADWRFFSPFTNYLEDPYTLHILGPKRLVGGAKVRVHLQGLKDGKQSGIKASTPLLG